MINKWLLEGLKPLMDNIAEALKQVVPTEIRRVRFCDLAAYLTERNCHYEGEDKLTLVVIAQLYGYHKLITQFPFTRVIVNALDYEDCTVGSVIAELEAISRTYRIVVEGSSEEYAPPEWIEAFKEACDGT